MSWGAVVAGGAAIVGSAISSSGAKSNAKEASEASEEQLEFAKEQYADWQAVYGPIQDNLASYYGNITPEYYEAIGIEAIEGEFEVVREDLARSMAQRGIEDSGVGLALEKDLGIQEAEAKAEVRRMAPTMAAEEQSRFLQIGMGTNPSSSVSQALSQQAATSQRIAEQSSAAAGQAISDTVNIIGTGLADYLENN
jgi:hypothetical protein